MSEGYPVWAQILSGLAILALLWFFGPSAWRAAKNSPKGTASDWLGLLVPIGGVVLFIVLLIAVARG